MLRRFLFASAILAAGWSFTSLTASHAWGQTNHAENLKSIISESTLGVGWVNLQTADLKAWQELLTSVGLPNEPDNWKQIEDVRAQLIASKATHIYLVGEFASIAQGIPLVVVLSKDPAATKALIEKNIPMKPNTGILAGKDAVIVGPKDRLGRIADPSKATADSKLLTRLALTTTDHGAIVSIPKPSREILSSLMVTRPDTPVAKEIVPLLSELDTVQLTFDESKKKMNAVAEFESEQSAQKFHQSFVSNAIFDPTLPDTYKPSVKESSVRWDLEGLAPMKQTFQATGAIRLARAQASSMRSMNNLKQIALAFHNFEAAYQTFPPQALVSKDGKKLLSWRVLLLPFIEQQALYEQFHLDEPWDSAHNRTLIDKIPQIYAAIGGEHGKTTYQALLTPDSAFGRPGKPIQFSDIKDGTSNTLWLTEVDVADAIAWTRPDDYQVVSEDSLKKLYLNRDAVPFGFIDGSVRTIPKSLDFDTFKKLLSIQGGELVQIP